MLLSRSGRSDEGVQLSSHPCTVIPMYMYNGQREPGSPCILMPVHEMFLYVVRAAVYLYHCVRTPTSE